MAQTLDEQIGVVERALGECMIDTALVVVRTWLTELGENNSYEEAFADIQKRHRALFAKWLNVDDPADDEELTKLTGEAYQLVDAVYADLRLLRGLSPRMHGFNPDSTNSVMHYFENSVRLRPEDLEWFHETLQDESRREIAMVAVTALAYNLRTCFSIDAFMALIDGIEVEEELVSGMCVAYTLMLLIQYDVRIDFFPQIQDAFVGAVGANDNSDAVFELLCAMIRNEQILRVIPHHDAQYLHELIPLIPQTWLYAILIEGSTEREHKLAFYSIQAGCRDLMWDYPDVGERYFMNVIRDGSTNPLDYINYAHCLLLKGDRMMAFENYLEARKLCGSSKEFFNLFRPDRKQLVDHGIPMEHVYMLEDKLLESHA